MSRHDDATSIPEGPSRPANKTIKTLKKGKTRRGRMQRCVVCLTEDPGGSGAWACHAGLDVTPVHRGKCFGMYVEGQRALLVRDHVRDDTPVPMLLWCPQCGERHLDLGDFARRPHRTHVCQDCGMTWRPALVATVGVQFLPGHGPGASK